jgi:hypothetical protein
MPCSKCKHPCEEQRRRLQQQRQTAANRYLKRGAARDVAKTTVTKRKVIKNKKLELLDKIKEKEKQTTTTKRHRGTKPSKSEVNRKQFVAMTIGSC